MQKNEAVVILGASNKTDRYAYMAQQGLVNRGFRVLPVHPTIKEIDGVPVFASLSDIKEPVNTITLYVGEERSTAVMQEILNLKPKRIIFNPGAENKSLQIEARKLGIEALDACTLVMLSTNNF